MDQYLSRNASLPVGESKDSPLLPAPLTPRRIIEKLVSGLIVASPTGETSVAVAQPRMPDLSREGPFDVHQDCSTSGASPRVLDSMRGCQYRMASYDEENGGPDYIYMIRGCWNMWVRQSRLDCSAIVRSTGFITWDMIRRFQLRYSSGMMRA